MTWSVYGQSLLKARALAYSWPDMLGLDLFRLRVVEFKLWQKPNFRCAGSPNLHLKELTCALPLQEGKSDVEKRRGSDVATLPKP